MKKMNYARLKSILLKYYGIDNVKHLLATNSTKRPSFKKMIVMFENDNIPFEAWINIREWLAKQEDLQEEEEIESELVLLRESAIEEIRKKRGRR